MELLGPRFCSCGLGSVNKRLLAFCSFCRFYDKFSSCLICAHLFRDIQQVCFIFVSIAVTAKQVCFFQLVVLFFLKNSEIRIVF